MSLLRTTDKLYNAVKRAGSGHELDEVEKVAAGLASRASGAVKGGSIQGHRG